MPSRLPFIGATSLALLLLLLLAAVTVNAEGWTVVATAEVPVDVLGAGNGVVGVAAGPFGTVDQLTLLGKDSVAVIAIEWTGAAKDAFTVRPLAKQAAVDLPEGFDGFRGGVVTNATGTVTLFASLLSGSTAGVNCTFGVFALSASSGNWSLQETLTTGLPSCDFVTAVNGPAIGLPSPFLVSAAADNVTALDQFLWPPPSNHDYSSTPRRPLPLRVVGGSGGIHHVTGASVVGGTAFIVASAIEGNPYGADLFVYDMMAVFHAEQPFAPLVSTGSLAAGMSCGKHGVSSRVVGLTTDHAGHLWVIARCSGGKVLLGSLRRSD